MATRKSRKEYLANYYETVVKPRRDKLLAEGICCYCGRKEPLTQEHILPRSRGGKNDLENIRMACRSCNLGRGNRPIEAWRTSIARKIAGVPDFGIPQRKWVADTFGRDPYDVDSGGVVFEFEGGPSNWRDVMDALRK